MSPDEPVLTPPSPAARPRLVLRDAKGAPYTPAVGPRLKLVLGLLFAGFALLGATGIYLLSLRLLNLVFAPHSYENVFSLWMFAAHEWLGVLFVAPFLFFGLTHYAGARRRPNRRAVRLGVAFFLAGLVVCLTGLALIQIPGAPQLPTETAARALVLWLHVLVPVAAAGLYVLHRRAGPPIQWRWGGVWGGAVGVAVLAMAVLHVQDPRRWYVRGSPEGERYFEPSKARTVDGNFIPDAALMKDEYCLNCHRDAYERHVHSAHKFSSFNNPAYLFSVRETRKVVLERDGSTRASRWCAGCHDPVPFFSGAFDDPNFDDVHHPTAHAGITCTVCHAVVHVNSRAGNADFTIEEPLHYPFAYSDNPVLQWLNQQLVKAKPEFHKKTFLKPFHRSEEFCSTCHKVSLPLALNHYKEFLRGQNHADSFLLSGVSGHGARSFYYPPEAKTRCAECHMPLTPSSDFGARDFDGSGVRKIHDHLFLGANTGLPALLRYPGHERVTQAHADFLRDNKLRIDLFGLKEGGAIDGRLAAPLRPELPRLEPGRTYLVEVVIRTVNMGHHFTQGTVDSNEVWVELEARAGDRALGRSGGLDAEGRVDEWAHFVNVLLLDRHGRRIDRRNPQDIFTPLYDHQIPPGTAQVVHYRLDVPKDVRTAVTLTARLRYRKFDYTYMRHVHPDGPAPVLPVVDLCEDRVTLPVAGVAESVPKQGSPIRPAWQRWNDYGIGCLLEGGAGLRRGELRQAREAFQKLVTLGDPDAEGHGHLNLARVAFEEGRLADAVESLNRARTASLPAPWWTVAWFTGLVNAQNGHLDEAVANFEQILDPRNQPRERKFDFTKDYVVRNELARTLFKRAQQEVDDPAERDRFLRRAVAHFERTLEIDPEDLDAHYGLAQCYAGLGQGSGVRGQGSGVREEGELLALGRTLADGKESWERRVEAAEQLGRAVAAFGEQPPDPQRPKLPLIQALIRQCRPVAAGETDPRLRAAAAQVLGRLHRQAHAIFKPDENAKDRAVRRYRKEHPAADHAAEAVVIYSLYRAGAP